MGDVARPVQEAAEGRECLVQVEAAGVAVGVSGAGEHHVAVVRRSVDVGWPRLVPTQARQASGHTAGASLPEGSTPSGSRSTVTERAWGAWTVNTLAQDCGLRWMASALRAALTERRRPGRSPRRRCTRWPRFLSSAWAGGGVPPPAVSVGALGVGLTRLCAGTRGGVAGAGAAGPQAAAHAREALPLGVALGRGASRAAGAPPGLQEGHRGP